MKELNVSLIDTPRPPAPFTVRDWAAVGFRQRRILRTTFLLIFGAVLLITVMTPSEYESEAKILVKRERVDPVVTADKNAQPLGMADLTEQDLNSEVEILKSRDLLEKVAITSGLPAKLRESRLKTLAIALGWISDERPAAGEDIRTFRATRQLEKNLTVEPLKKTKLIRVSYRSTDPKLATTVLQNLVRMYTEKHLEVHRVGGALDFFETQTEQYRKQLANAEQQMAAFGKSNGVVAPQLEKEMAVRKLTDFEAELGQTRAAITSTEKKIAELEKLQAARPARLTSQVRTADNPLLLQQMRTTLLNLELKRTELLSKYAPDYPPVQEVEAQIAQTREALTKAESSPVREEVTDRDTTHEWLTSELAKARAELTSLEGKLAVTLQTVNSYQQQAQQLNNTEIAQQDLVRTVKEAEDNFVLYSRKQEEARISQALDQKRIINVSIAEEPTVPVLPASPDWVLNLMLGALLAALAGIGLALARDHMDSSFRTPDEVEVFLSVPVLASLALEPGER
jgi:uncharacterized protein involved in exopolysaccharide biosynthesis